MKLIATFIVTLLMSAGAMAGNVISIVPEAPPVNWLVYPMKTADDSDTSVERTSSEVTAQAAAVGYCQMEYDLLKSEGVLDALQWGYRVVNPKTHEAKAFECAKYITPTN